MLKDHVLLAGDIGGTKTTLACYNLNQWPGQPVREETYANNSSTCLEGLIQRFISGLDQRPTIACFGAAGPIQENRVRLTNLDWTISADDLTEEFGWAGTYLINDLVATAMGAVMLPRSDLLILNQEEPGSGAAAVIAPGTGLGEAILAPSPSGYIPLASEGGHASFAPRTDEQIELLTWMHRQHDHVSYEHVCSGTGIPNLFAFIKAGSGVPAELGRALEQTDNPTPVIIKAALDAFRAGNLDHVAVRTVNLFIDILADEAANLALKALTTGGLYIAGGLPLRIMPLLDRERFMAIFSRGLYSKWLRTIPIRLVLNPKTAVLGAAAYGFNQTSLEDSA